MEQIIFTESILFDLSSDTIDLCKINLSQYIATEVDDHTIIRIMLAFIISRPETIELMVSIFKYFWKMASKNNQLDFTKIWLAEIQVKISEFREILFFYNLLVSEKIVDKSLFSMHNIYCNGKQKFYEYPMDFNKEIRPNKILDFISKDNLKSLIMHINSCGIDLTETIIVANQYERCTPIDKSICSLIEAAAFFGSSNCFKYFLLLKIKCRPEIMRYAIMGGSVEIIHLIEDKFPNLLSKLETISLELIEIGIMYHRLEIVQWLLEYYKLPDSNMAILAGKAIMYCSYNIFYSCFRLYFNFQSLEKLVASDHIYDYFLTLYFLESQKKRMAEADILRRNRFQLSTIILSAIRDKNFSFFRLLLDSIPSLSTILESQVVDIILKYSNNDDSGMQIVHYLLSSGQFDLNQERSIRRSVGGSVEHPQPLLLYACDGNMKNLLEELLGHAHLNVNAKCSDSDFGLKNALDSCCENCSPELLFLFINKTQSKVHVNLPLHFACRGNKLENFKIAYFSLDIDITKQDPKHRTCLYYACENDQSEFVEYILSLKHCVLSSADIHSSFFCALKMKSNKSILSFLKSELIDINQVESLYGYTPLHMICNTNNIEIVRDILAYKGIDINKKNIAIHIEFD